MGNISRIRDLADKKGVQISFLSQAIGKSSGYLANVTSRDADVPVKYLPTLATTLGTSVDYLLGKTDDPSEADSNMYIGNEYGTFQYDRFYALCKQQGKTQSHLYELVGLPSKAGSNLRRTKNVKPEILEVWAKELHTTAAYLNGETDDPSPVPAPAAPEQKEKPNALDGIELEKLSPARRALLEALDGMTEENIMKLVRIAQAVKIELPE